MSKVPPLIPGQEAEPQTLPAPPLQPDLAQPQLVQTIPYFTPATGPEAGGVWSMGSILVMHKKATLPPQCIKCCAPADGPPLRRTLGWHTPWLYLLLPFMLPGWILLAIIGLCVQERATIYIPLCAQHRLRRRINLAMTWVMFLAAIACAIIAANIRDRDVQGVLFWATVVLAVTAPIYGLVACRMVAPTKIDRQYVWLKGASREFVGQFPALLPQ